MPSSSPAMSGPHCAGTALAPRSAAHRGAKSRATSRAISGTSGARRLAIFAGSRRRNVSCTSISLVVTISTMVMAICAAFAGTMPCHPNAPRGLRTGYPYTRPSTACASGTPKKPIG